MHSAEYLSNMQYIELIETLGRNKLYTLTAPNKNNYIKHNMGRDERKKKRQSEGQNWSKLCSHFSTSRPHLQTFTGKRQCHTYV